MHPWFGMDFPSEDEQNLADCPDESKYAREDDPCEDKKCNGHYVLRTNRFTGDEFLGCSCFPDCRSTKRVSL